MIRPLAKNIVVKIVQPEKPCIILTVRPSDTGQPFKAILVSKGKDVSLDMDVGDVLMIAAFGGIMFDENDEEHLLMTEKDVLGVVL